MSDMVEISTEDNNIESQDTEFRLPSITRIKVCIIILLNSIATLN